MTCILCESPEVNPIHVTEKNQTRSYGGCRQCGFVFLEPFQRLGVDEEKVRYEQHTNDVKEVGYQKFVRPLVNAVSTFYASQAEGLDYGSGPDSAASFLLREKGYSVHQFDPFFRPNFEVLKPGFYDFIVLCEVVEHFYEPLKEFEKLKVLLKPQGRLFIMTSLLTEKVDFNSWYYRRDVTHVGFFNETSFNFIKTKLGFSDLVVNSDNLVTLEIRKS